MIGAGIDRRAVGELRRVLDVASSVTLGFVLLADTPRRGASTGLRRLTAPVGAQEATTLPARPMVGEAP